MKPATMLFRVVCSDGIRFSMLCQVGNIAAVKSNILENHLRVAQRYAVYGRSDESEAAQTIVAVKDYYGFDLPDGMDCKILCDMGPNPHIAIIGVIFERDLHILKARLPDSLSLLRALSFCGRRASFDFQTCPSVTKVTGGSHETKRRDAAGDAASMHNFRAKNLDGSALLAAKKRKVDEDCGTEDADETASKVGRVSERCVWGRVGFHTD